MLLLSALALTEASSWLTLDEDGAYSRLTVRVDEAQPQACAQFIDRFEVSSVPRRAKPH